MRLVLTPFFSPRLTAILSHPISCVLAAGAPVCVGGSLGPVRRLFNCFVASCRLCVVDGRCKWGCQWLGGCGRNVCDLGPLLALSSHAYHMRVPRLLGSAWQWLGPTWGRRRSVWWSWSVCECVYMIYILPTWVICGPTGTLVLSCTWR